MNRIRIDGAGLKAGGVVREAAGKLTGNRRLQAMGTLEKVSGTVKNAVGKAADRVRGR